MSEGDKQVEITAFATFGSIMSVLMVASVVGNIICFRLTNRMVRNKPSLTLVLNLNISDILVTLCTWIAFMTQHISRQTETKIDVIVHKVFWSAIITLGNLTILTLTGLAADCFIALRWPLHYRDISTEKATRIYISVSWILSVISGFGDFLVAAFDEASSYQEAVRDTMVFSSAKYHSVTSKLTASFTMLLSNSLSLLCLLLLVIIYSYILTKIKRIKLNKTLSKQGGFRSQVHAVRTTLMVFTSFLLLFVPTLAVNIVTVIQPDFLSKLSLIEGSFIGYTADCLLLVHSTVNALIYGVRVSKTIHRQRRTQLTLQDYIRQSRAGSTYTNSISSYSFTPSRHESDGVTSLAQHCIDRVGSVTFGTAAGLTLNLKDRRSMLHTISETGETSPPCDIHECPEYNQLAEQTGDDDSVDEGIGTHSESGSDEHDLTLLETQLQAPPSQDTGQSELPHRAQTLHRNTSISSKLDINIPQHRKATYKRSKSLDYLPYLFPQLDRKGSNPSATEGGVINWAFMEDYNSNQIFSFSKQPLSASELIKWQTTNTGDIAPEQNDTASESINSMLSEHNDSITESINSVLSQHNGSITESISSVLSEHNDSITESINSVLSEHNDNTAESMDSVASDHDDTTTVIAQMTSAHNDATLTSAGSVSNLSQCSCSTSSSFLAEPNTILTCTRL